MVKSGVGAPHGQTHFCVTGLMTAPLTWAQYAAVASGGMVVTRPPVSKTMAFAALVLSGIPPAEKLRLSTSQPSVNVLEIGIVS